MMGDNGTIQADNRIGTEVEVVQYCMEENEGPIGPNPRNSSPQIPNPSPPYSTAYSSSPGPSVEGSPTSVTRVDSDTHVDGHLPNATFKYDEEATSTEVRAASKQPLFATEVFQRVVFATILGLGLQQPVPPFSFTLTRHQKGLAAAL